MKLAQKIKIVRIISRLNIGGPAYNVKILSEGLPQNYDTVLVTGKTDPHEGDMSYVLGETNQVRYVYLPELGRNIHGVKEIVAFVKLFLLLRREKPDIVCTHASKAGFLGRTAAFFARVPVVIHTFHGHVFENYFGAIVSKLIIWTERILAKITTKIIAISDTQKEELAQKYKIAPPHKIHVARLGFDLTPFQKPPVQKEFLVQKYGFPQNKFLIGIVGRLVPIKNHSYFFQAALEVLKTRQDVHFVVVGDGELRRHLLLEAMRLGIQSSVSFLGWQKELKSIYDVLDLVVLTSKNEGTPVSLIEAQACGKPVIATDVGGVKDIVFHGKNGFVIDANDPKRFANCMTKLLEDASLRAEMGSFGKDLVFENYTQTKLLHHMSQLYQTCV